MTSTEILQTIAHRLRKHSIEATTKAGSGHPSSCLSMAEIMAYLFFEEMHYNVKNPFDEGNDEFILSKGHAAPILYGAYAEAGIIPKEKLLTLRKIDSNLEGHPTPLFKWVKIATGSLGQGLTAGVGMALAQKLKKTPARTFVVLGDGEMAEGSNWEAFNLGAYYNLSNLYAIIDVNRLGQSQETMHGRKAEIYQQKLESFGWEVALADGHSLEGLRTAFAKLKLSSKPKIILARTIKGKGCREIEDKEGWHGKALPEELAKRTIASFGYLGKFKSSTFIQPAFKVQKNKLKVSSLEFTNYPPEKEVATRQAYGNALLNLGKAQPLVVALDGDVKNSTHAELFFKQFPARSFECYIAEQGMIGMGIGLAAKGYLPFVATFAAFLTRAHDFIRMGAYSNTNCKFMGSHAGVSIGEDGPSQMGLEDLALFRSVPDCLVLQPCDAFSTERCVELMFKQKGMAYLRTLRPATPIIYNLQERFVVGGSKVLKQSNKDVVTIIASGITVHEALRASELLQKEKLFVQVIDAYSIQPLDIKGINKAVRKTKGKVIVVEDHYQAGGLGEAVKMALSEKLLGNIPLKMEHLCVREMPRSGKKEELLAKYGIDAEAIVRAVKKVK